MSYCKQEGKDKVVFLTKEDSQKKSQLELRQDNNDDVEDLYPSRLNEDGTLNWKCPCLSDATVGPCAYEIREFISCTHNGFLEREKGKEPADCFDTFLAMHQCIQKYPGAYADLNKSMNDDDDDEDSELAMAQAEAEAERLVAEQDVTKEATSEKS